MLQICSALLPARSEGQCDLSSTPQLFLYGCPWSGARQRCSGGHRQDEYCSCCGALECGLLLVHSRPQNQHRAAGADEAFLLSVAQTPAHVLQPTSRSCVAPVPQKSDLLQKLPHPVLTTRPIASPEEMKQLLLCRRGGCVRTPFAVPLKIRNTGGVLPCVGCSRALVS